MINQKLKKCPQCGKKTFVVSIFGSICSDEKCFYEEKDYKKPQTNMKNICCEKCYTVDSIWEKHCKNSNCPCHKPEGVGESEKVGTDQLVERLYRGATVSYEENWEEEFNKLWGGYPANKKQNTQGLDSLMKDFISRTLLQEKAKWKEQIIKLENPFRETSFQNAVGWDTHKTEVLTLIDKL